MRAIGKNKTTPVYLVALSFNLVLFAVKLYIGLASNSISIYSDGINNLFDGLSCVVALVFAFIVARSETLFSKTLSHKAQQLLTLAVSLMIFFVGAVFFLNSLERLMYPAPVWFSVYYFTLLFVTALVKLVLFFYLRRQAVRCSSSVLKVMSLDSLTDFFITSATVLTLLLSQKGGYSLDAFAGIGISIVIILSSVKNIKRSGEMLLNLPEKKKRERLKEILDESNIGEDLRLDFSFSEESRAYIEVRDNFNKEAIEALKEKVYNETGIKLYAIK